MTEKLKNLRLPFVEQCNNVLLNQLLDDLLEKEIFIKEEVQLFKDGHTSEVDKYRKLFDQVQNKGKHSCNIFIEQLIKRDPKLSQTLGLIASDKLPLPAEEKKNEQPSKSDNGIIQCTENEYKEITSKAHEMYPIKDKDGRKRLALIICNKNFVHYSERKGAEADSDGMEGLLKGLGYEIQLMTDLTAEQMRKTMKDFAAETDHKDSDSTFLVFMSHGERDVICGTDCNKTHNEQDQETMTGALHVDEIFNTFNNVNCPGLRDKPKVIVIQACRGDEESQVLVRDAPSAPYTNQTDELESDIIRRIQKERDFICFYSTTPDTFSLRHKKDGSLFIQKLIEIMKEEAHCSSLEDIFRKVQYSFKDGKQMPTQERKTLMKKFFLLPGY